MRYYVMRKGITHEGKGKGIDIDIGATHLLAHNAREEGRGQDMWKWNKKEDG